MFGFRFKRAYPSNVASGGVYSGNASQRRKQRRTILREINKLRETL
jgi:hypothetical protein